MDILTPSQRRERMRAVARSSTDLEMALRRGLHSLGFRYLVNDPRLPGTPDIVLPKFGAAIFVHGCFWHGHHCRAGRVPATNVSYWRPKLEANRVRDAQKRRELRRLGWRVLTVWGCQLEGEARRAKSIKAIARWITAGLH